MRKTGTVVHWDADQGFGFIDDGQDGPDLMFQKDDYRNGPQPRTGMTVSFRRVDGGDRGPRAASVMPSLKVSGEGSDFNLEPLDRPSEWAQSSLSELSRLDAMGAPRRRRADTGFDTGWIGFIPLLAVWVWLLLTGVQTGRVHLAALGLLALVNLVTPLLYHIDKEASDGGRWRVSERRLHVAALLGGWPLAWVTLQILGHKSRRSAFRQLFWATVSIHTAALAVWVYWPMLASGIHSPG